MSSKKAAVKIVNDILSSLNISFSINSIQDCTPSLWIALFEGIFKTKLPGDVIRADSPYIGTLGARISNSQILLENLSSILGIDLAHLSAEQLANGDERECCFLADIFKEVAVLLIPVSGECGQPEAEEEEDAEEVGITYDFEESDQDIRNYFRSQPSISSSPIRSSKYFQEDEDVEEFLHMPSTNISFTNVSNGWNHSRKRSSIDDSNIFKSTTSSISMKPSIRPHKKSRFEANVSSAAAEITSSPSSKPPQTTPVQLKVTPSDTPHMKALKIRQARLLREKRALSSRSHHADVNFNKSKRRIINRSTEHYQFKTNVQQADELEEKEEESSIDEADLLPVGPKTRSEYNLQKFKSNAKKIVGTWVPISKKLEDDTWNSQVGIWKKALDDRIWSRKVAEIGQRKIQDSNKEKKYVQKSTEESIRLANLFSKKAKQRQAISEINDRHRKVIRMTKRQAEAEQEVENFKKKRVLEKDNMLKKSFSQFLKTQRDAIIEERRFEKEERDSKIRADRIAQEAQENYFNDQIKMLEEQLKETKKNDAIARKAQNEELRRLEREAKKGNIAKIKLIKEKLVTDADLFLNQERELEELKKMTRFRFLKKT